MAWECEISGVTTASVANRPLGVILAGGLSSRMGGGDKALLTLAEATLLDRVQALLAQQVDEIVVNANGDPARFEHIGLPVIKDTLPDFPGPLAGVLAGMEYAASRGASEIVTVAADTPFFPKNLVSQLQSAKQHEGTPLAMAMTPDPERGQARHPTFGLWPVSLAGDLRTALLNGTRKIVAWTEQHGCARALFETDPFDPFFNINTPQDLERAKSMITEYGL